MNWGQNPTESWWPEPQKALGNLEIWAFFKELDHGQSRERLQPVRYQREWPTLKVGDYFCYLKKTTQNKRVYAIKAGILWESATVGTSTRNTRQNPGKHFQDTQGQLKLVESHCPAHFLFKITRGKTPVFKTFCCQTKNNYHSVWKYKTKQFETYGGKTVTQKQVKTLLSQKEI